MPILVGGTGLYLRTLLDGIAPVPAIDPDMRARVREAPVEENHAKLSTLDPDAAARLNAAGHRADHARARSHPVDRPDARANGRRQREGGIGEAGRRCSR